MCGSLEPEKTQAGETVKDGQASPYCKDFVDLKAQINRIIAHQNANDQVQEPQVIARINAYPKRNFWVLSVGLAWILSILAVFYAGAITYTYSIAPRYPGRKGTVPVIGLAFCSGLLIFIAINYINTSRGNPLHTWRLLSDVLLAGYFPSLDSLKPINDGISLIAALFLSLSASILLYRVSGMNEGEASNLAQHFKYFRYLIYLGALMLVVNVVRIHSLLDWANAFIMQDLWTYTGVEETLMKKTYENITHIYQSVVWSLGMMYSLMLLALYLPGKVIFDSLVQEPVPDPAGDSDSESPQPKRLKGLQLSSAFKNYLAIASPVLTGPVLDLILSIFSGL